jgi:hypothetical protein
MPNTSEDSMANYITCPACNYTRQAADDAVPEWECPKCQKAYIKSAQAEHPQEPVVMAQSSSDYIQVSISGENNLEPGSLIQFGASQDVDPLAMQTKWTPVITDRRGMDSRDLVEVSPGRVEFRRTKGSRAFGLILVLVGIVSIICTIYSRRAFSSGKDLLAIGIYFLFIVFGYGFLYMTNKMVVLDKIRGYFWKGRKTSDEVPDMNTVQDLTSLDSIHALQLVYWRSIASNVTSEIIELNLVLRNGGRVNVAAYQVTAGNINRSFCNFEKKPRESAVILGRFLGRPVWDAIDSTKSYWVSKRRW